jgi:hypothetical protein
MKVERGFMSDDQKRPAGFLHRYFGLITIAGIAVAFIALTAVISAS